MSETPPPIPPLGVPKEQAIQNGDAPATTGANAQYNRIADKVGLVPNLRKKDNLYQGIGVLAFAVIGMTVGWFWDGAPIRDLVGDGWLIRITVGALVGLVVGALLSGLIIMALGFLRHNTSRTTNGPPVINPTETQSRHSRLTLFLAIAFAAFASVCSLLLLSRSQRLQAELTETSRQLDLARSELESAKRDLAKAPVTSQDAEVGKKFTGLRQVFDYYETKGFIMLGRFEQSQWPAKVVHQKEGTNEIRFVRKRGPSHTYPGYTGYRLRVVSLEDSAGEETVVVLRSKDKISSE